MWHQPWVPQPEHHLTDTQDPAVLGALLYIYEFSPLYVQEDNSEMAQSHLGREEMDEGVTAA